MIIGFFTPSSNTAQIFLLDTVRTNNIPNLNNLLNTEREKRLIGIKKIMSIESVQWETPITESNHMLKAQMKRVNFFHWTTAHYFIF